MPPWYSPTQVSEQSSYGEMAIPVTAWGKPLPSRPEGAYASSLGCSSAPAGRNPRSTMHPFPRPGGAHETVIAEVIAHDTPSCASAPPGRSRGGPTRSPGSVRCSGLHPGLLASAPSGQQVYLGLSSGATRKPKPTLRQLFTYLRGGVLRKLLDQSLWAPGCGTIPENELGVCLGACTRSCSFRRFPAGRRRKRPLVSLAAA